MSTLWKSPLSLHDIHVFNQGTAISHCGIEIIEIGDDYVLASMPVDQRTKQPMGLLHGGSSVLLAETVGSIASIMAAEPGSRCVGLEVNANHLKTARNGLVYAKATPIKIGKRIQVWSILIKNESGDDVCISRLTVSVD